jgi:phosphatidylglycerol---prolipoprotein diacylglyceryl transferase
VHKIALQIPFFWGGHWTTLPIHWYGVLVAVGFLLGLWTASRRSPRDGIAPEKILDAGPWLILGAIIGARTLYVISYWENFAANPIPEIFMIQKGGLVFYGGLVGAIASALLFLRIKRIPVWKFGDALAPSIALGYFFGRFGCLMNGCCWGKPTDLPWAIHFPSDHETHGFGVHPTQVYEALLNLLLYLGLAWLYRRKKFDGQIFALYMICYPLLRSFVEMFRGDYSMHYLGGWATPAQLFSFAILAAGLVLLFLLPKTQAKVSTTA